MPTPPEIPERAQRERAALESLAKSAARTDATTFALRYGLARRPGRGIVAGVCAAFVDAYGLPVRLLRVFLVLLALLGPGLFVYLLLFLLIPRMPVTAKNTQGREEFDIPARSLSQGHVQPGDLVVAISLVPAAGLAVAAAWAYITRLQLAVAFLLPVTLLLALVLAIGMWRSSRARTTYLFAALARQAGIVSEKDLWRTVDELRQEAPRAWRHAGAVAGEGKPHDADPAPRISSWQAFTPIAVCILASLILFSLASFYPNFMPWVDPQGPLAGVARAGMSLSLVGCGAGLSLVWWGRRGHRSPELVAAGLVCVLAFAASVTWVRLTDSRGEKPIVLAVEEYEPGAYIRCNPGGIRQWKRPVILDFSALKNKPSEDEALQMWQARNPGYEPGVRDLTMTVECSRVVGDVKVILPSSQWPVDVNVSTALGTYEDPTWEGFQREDSKTVSLVLSGELGTGSIAYVRPDGGGDGG